VNFIRNEVARLGIEIHNIAIKSYKCNDEIVLFII